MSLGFVHTELYPRCFSLHVFSCFGHPILQPSLDFDIELENDICEMGRHMRLICRTMRQATAVL